MIVRLSDNGGYGDLFPQVMPGDWPCAVGCGCVQLWADGRLIWSGDDETMTLNWLRGVYGREIRQAKRVRLNILAPLYHGIYEYDHERRQFRLVKAGGPLDL